MTSAPAPGRSRQARPAAVVDRFGLVVTLGVAVLWAVAGIPAFADAPYVPDLPLLVALGLVCVPATIQWLALLRRFEVSPPIPPAAGAVVLTLVLAAWAGQLGAILGLVAGLVVAYGWRIAQASSSRIVDVAYDVTAVVLFGLFPAQVLLLRRLDIGARGFYLYLAVAVAFAAVQSVLARPARDGTRRVDVSTAAAAVAAVIVSLVGGVLAGPQFGAWGGFLTGLAIAAACIAGRACLPLLAQAPVVDGRRIRRPPLLLDALAPLLFAAPAGFLVLRAISAG